MIYLNQLKDYHIYKNPFMFPSNGNDKRKGNIVYLITPNIDSSTGVINHRLLKDNKYYNGYYIERNVTYYVNLESNCYEKLLTNTVTIHEQSVGTALSYLNEFGRYITEDQYIMFEGHPSDIKAVREFVTIDKLNELSDKLGLNTPIQLNVIIGESNGINSCLSVNQIGEELAADYYDSFMARLIVESNFKNMDETNKVLVRGYLTEASNRFAIKDNDFENELSSMNQIQQYSFLNETLCSPYYKDLEPITESENPITTIRRKITRSINKGGARTLDKTLNDIESGSTTDTSHNNSIEDIESEIATATPKLEAVDELIFDSRCNKEEVFVESDVIKAGNFITFFNEADKDGETQLYKMLYKERLRGNKELFEYYDIVKTRCHLITQTAVNTERYQGKNLYVDLFYYNNLFFKNNIYKLDRGVDLYQAFLYRAMNNTKLKSYTGTKTVIIPVKDWVDNIKTRTWLYKNDINPISMITRLLQKDIDMIKELFKDMEVVFLAEKSYFKVNFNNVTDSDYNEFINTLKKLYYLNPSEIEDEIVSSKEAIRDKLLDDIESSQGIKISYLTGNGKKNEEEAPTSLPQDNEKQIIDANEDSKKKVIDKIEKAADNATDVDEVIDALDNDDEFKLMLAQLADEEQNGVIINNARATRMANLNDALLDKKVKGMSVRDILNKKELLAEKEIEEIEVPIDSINDEWKHLIYANMNASYDPDVDIVAMLRSLADMSYPISIRDIEILDTSNKEDYLYTYTVEMENHQGKRFKIRFDIPKLINHEYMKLRGNKKSISSQSLLMPVLKTEEDTVQIVTNYNKIFVYRYGQLGKSNVVADRVIKTLNKQSFKDINVISGNNTLVCSKYEVPIDYIDFSSVYTKIEVGNTTMIFNYDILLHELEDKKIKVDNNKGFVFGFVKSSKGYEPLYFNANIFKYLSEQIRNILSHSSEFVEIYNSTKPSSKYMYSQASILSSKIPVILLLMYNLGLTKALNEAGIEYDFIEKKSAEDRVLENSNIYSFIQFKDGFLKYKENYNSSMLLNGLRDRCDTRAYSVTELNKRSVALELLDTFTERIKTDGLDNFADCLVDPITKEVCEHYGLPDTYTSLLIHANNLLADNKHFKHGNQASRRLRRNELIAAYFYKALSSSYGAYASSMKHGRETILTMKQSAVIDLIMLDPSSQDLSIINALKEKESYDAVTPKGLSGMNSDRSYSVDKRAYDDSMINVLGMSTGFASTVGINRQATINANVSTVRGYIMPSSREKMGSVNTLCMSEALTPMGTTRDDPFRSAMTFVQTTSHGMRVKHGDPLLITNGSDKALPYLISDIFAFKAKNDGEIVVMEPDSHMIVKYKDGSSEFVDLSAKVEKNSSSGFYVVLKLDTDLKLGDKVKKGSLLAYDRESFNANTGLDNDPAYLLGTLCYCALIDTDEGFEDSAKVNDVLSEAMSLKICEEVEISLDKNTNVYNVLNIGTPVKANAILMQMQRPYEEDDANALLKTLAADEESISQLGRRPIESPVTGIIQDIEVLRTCELDELSESLRALCKKYENKDSKRRADMKKYGIEQEYELRPNYKLPATGRLKGTPDGVKIIFQIAVDDKLGIGDKIIYYSANKGVVKDLFPKGEEPYLYGRPEVKLGALVSIGSTNGRMVTSIQNTGALNRVLVELAWKCKEKAGIPVDYSVPSYSDL